MTKRTCLGCGLVLTGDVATLEHILPQWLATEIDSSVSGINMSQFLHDDRNPTDTLLRSHGLNSSAAKKVCSQCNNGWMSVLETGV
jgi:hypothetical protein